ncbi:MAG: glycosyltransferase family 4 protein [Clostridia bacterium]|nr:glycosyltransferase family 4 protein [Clostridia bacterium]
MQMKVLIAANHDAGLYKFRKDLIEELLKKHEVYISLPYGDYIPELENLGCRFIDTPIQRRGMNPIKDLALLKKYCKMMKEIKPDYVVTYTIKPNIYGGVAAKLAKKNYAANITGLGTAFQGNGIIKKLVVVMYKIALRKAKRVFFENVENMQIFIDLGIIEKSQAYHLNGAGVNLSEFDFKEYPALEEETRFLFMGRVMAEKGIDELLTAMDRLVADGISCSLDILGDYEENYADIIKEYTQKGYVRYHGFQKDVRPFIENCHCFVLPSWHEGMANTLLESAAMGRPLITSNVHGCLEAVRNGESGFLAEIKNAESLAGAMKSFILLSYEEKIAMGKKGREHVERVFSKEVVVSETIKGLGI